MTCGRDEDATLMEGPPEPRDAPPGTVAYLGYGSSLVEPSAFRFHGLSRVSDGVFAKLSYLFRL